MKTLILKLTVILNCCLCSMGYSQEPAFLKYVEENAVLAGDLKNIGLVLDEAFNIERFQNNYTDAVSTLLFDEEFGLVSEEQSEKLVESMDELQSVLRSCEKVFFIVHELSDKHIGLSVAFQMAKGEDKTDFVKTIKIVNSALTAVLNEASKVFDAESPIQFSLKETGDWFILSNDDAAVEKLMSQLGEDAGNYRSMSESRKYKRAVAGLKGRKDSRCVASFFGNPSKLRSLFSYIDDKTWDSYRVGELPSFGAKVYLLPENDEASGSDLWLAFEATISKTQPAVGIGKYLNSFLPLKKIPELPGSIVSMSVESFDPKLRLDANNELTKSVKDTSFVEDLASRFNPDVFGDVEQSIALRCNSTISVTYKAETYQGLHNLWIERVSSANGAGMYFDGRVKSNNKAYSAKEQKFEAVEGRPGLFQAKINQDAQSRPFAESMFLGENYFVTGRFVDVNSFVEDCLAGGPVDWTETCNNEHECIGKYLKLGPNVCLFQRVGWERALDSASLKEDAVIKQMFRNDPPKFIKTITAKENEFGVRFDVDDPKTRREALKIAVAKSAIKCLGNRVVFLENENERLRLVGGLTR